MQISTELRLASVKLVHTKPARAEVELASPKPRELASCSMHSSCMSHTPAAGCTVPLTAPHFYATGCVITFAGVLYAYIIHLVQNERLVFIYMCMEIITVT